MLPQIADIMVTHDVNQATKDILGQYVKMLQTISQISIYSMLYCKSLCIEASEFEHGYNRT